MTPAEIAVKNGLPPDHPLLAPLYIERYEELFKRFDLDDSGLIDLGELKEMLQAVGQEVPMDDLRKLFEEFDEDDSGGIDFEEFIQIFVKIIGTADEREGEEENQPDEDIDYDNEDGPVNMRRTKLESDSDAEKPLLQRLPGKEFKIDAGINW